MSAEALLLICMCLMFSHGPCIPDGVKMKATYSALQAWIELFSVASGEWTGSHVPYYTVAWSILCSYPHFCFGNSPLTKARTLNSCPPYLTDVVFHCMILLLMVANVWLKSGKEREALEASCAFLAQPPSQSKCKWLLVMRKDSGCPFSIDTLLLCCSIPLSLLAFCSRSSLFGSLSGY